MSRAKSLLIAALLVVPMAASAATSPLRLPDFSSLSRQASEHTDISLDAGLLRFASHFAGDMSAQDRQVLAGLERVEIHAYEFDHDGAWPVADVEAVRHQLQSSSWTRLVQAHDAKAREDVDICLSMDRDAAGHEQANGLAILVTGPREVTLVNIVGRIDPEAFARLGGAIGLPSQATVALRAPLVTRAE